MRLCFKRIKVTFYFRSYIERIASRHLTISSRRSERASNKLCLNSAGNNIVWLKGIGAALKNSANCNKCGSVCNFVIKKGSYCWRCLKSGCQSVISMRDGSFSSGSHLKLNEIVEASVFNKFCGSNHWGTHSNY